MTQNPLLLPIKVFCRLGKVKEMAPWVTSSEELGWALLQQPSPHAHNGKQFPLRLTEAVTEQISVAQNFPAARFNVAQATPSLTEAAAVASHMDASVCRVK